MNLNLEKIVRKVVRTHEVISPELARDLAELANDSGHMIGVLVDRRGRVAHAVEGERDRLYLPDIGRARAKRLRGLRLLVAKPEKKVSLKSNSDVQYKLDPDFITDLEKLGLDLVLQFEAMKDGLPGRAVTASLMPGGSKIQNFRDVYAIDVDFSEFIAELENELESYIKRAKSRANVVGTREICVLVGVYTSSKSIWESSLKELQELARTANVMVVDTVIQRRAKLDPKTVVGAGKLEEICLNALHHGAEALIFDCDLSPSQLNAITDLTDLKIIDRTMLILDIFARRAITKGGKMQVELAQLKYSLPRLSKKQSGLSRLTGGIGGQGPGETKLEIDKRRVKEKITRIEKELEGLRSERKLRRKQRNTRKIPTVAIVGYTNAGKSTLLNALTNAEVYAADQLFATLDPTSRRLRFPKDRELILIDTVGFIRDLPEGLINAFRATLEELHEADLLLHVVDGSDEERTRHITVVNDVLDGLEITEPKRIIVMNKCDLLTQPEIEELALDLGAIPISAVTKYGFSTLVDYIDSALWNG